MTDYSSRREIAHSLEQYLSQVLSLEQLFANVPEAPDDEEVAELLDLIEHEPEQGGFLGVRPQVRFAAYGVAGARPEVTDGRLTCRCSRRAARVRWADAEQLLAPLAAERDDVRRPTARASGRKAGDDQT